jgi:hypothetical protein
MQKVKASGRSGPQGLAIRNFCRSGPAVGIGAIRREAICQSARKTGSDSISMHV